jgi:zinc/manganese transport system substrate-binding protein
MSETSLPFRFGIRPAALVVFGAIAAATVAGCSTSAAPSPQPTANHRVAVVAAENFWGSIASQLGGSHVAVTSIITNPNTDPHAYEPTAQDAITMARGQLVIENGVGYDPWAAKILAGNQGNQTVLNVGSLVDAQPGDNPHRWYNPADVQVVIRQIVTDLSDLDPADRGYFMSQAQQFDSVALAQYDSVIAAIKARYGGAPVGASESIFAMLAPALGLNLITPPSFLRAISEGENPTVADIETIDNQIDNHLIKIYVYNSQNVTPDVQAQLELAKAHHIPVATITETLQPASSSYQAWQTRQLQGIEQALQRSSGQ